MVSIKRAVSLAGLSWLAWRAFGPEIPRRMHSDQRRPLRIPGRTVFVGEREFFVRETGPEGATPLVLLHGWSFDGEMTFFNVIERFAERFRVVVPDHRGHGKSDWIRGRYEIADVADDVAGVLQALDISNAVVLGYSMGGMVAQELAHRHPSLVDRLVLAATAARPVRADMAFRLAVVATRAVARISRKELSAAPTVGSCLPPRIRQRFSTVVSIFMARKIATPMPTTSSSFMSFFTASLFLSVRTSYLGRRMGGQGRSLPCRHGFA